MPCRSYQAPDDAPDTVRISAHGLVALVAHDPAAPCHVLDLTQEEGRVDGEGLAFVVLGTVSRPSGLTKVYAEGGIRLLLTSPTARELELLDLAHLEAIRDGFAVKTTAKTTAGLAKAIEAHVAGMP